MATDKERLARFEREAKVLAQLSHANIATVHGFDHHEGTSFLVMEHVAGEDLSERLRRGALPVEEAIEIGQQIAEALEAAHARGIVHRDLKPANIKVTAEGHVKVLDFGLAKALEADSEVGTAYPRSTTAAGDGSRGRSPHLEDDSPTITDAFTKPGTILGTAAYMSPEQAKGKSVDGLHLVYAARGSDLGPRLFHRTMDQTQVTRIETDGTAALPTFSPDGKWILHHRFGGRLREVYKVPFIGGDTELVAKVWDFSVLADLEWLSNGIVVISPDDGALMQAPALGGEPEPFSVLDSERGEVSHRLVSEVLGAQAVVYNVWGQDPTVEPDIALQRFGERDHRILLEKGMDPRFMPDPKHPELGYLLFIRDSGLMAVRIRTKALVLDGEPVRILEDVMFASSPGKDPLNMGAAQVAVARNGILAYVTGGTYPTLESRLVLVDRAGEAIPFSGDKLRPDTFENPRFSPDGRKLAYSIEHDDTERDLWVLDLESGIPERLTDEGWNGSPVWSPDGGSLVFAAARGGDVKNLYRISASGGGQTPERLTTDNSDQLPTSVSMDGTIAFNWNDDIWLLSPEGTARPFFESDDEEHSAAFSPDGRWIAYASDQASRADVYVRPFPGPGLARRLTDANNDTGSFGYNSPVWSADGRSISLGRRTFDNPGWEMSVLEIETEPTFRVVKRERLWNLGFRRGRGAPGYDVSSSGNYVMVSYANEDYPPPDRIQVVVNWVEELRAKFPPVR